MNSIQYIENNDLNNKHKEINEIKCKLIHLTNEVKTLTNNDIIKCYSNISSCDEQFNDLINSIETLKTYFIKIKQTYLFDVHNIFTNELTLEHALDCAVKNLVEGCVFVNPQFKHTNAEELNWNKKGIINKFGAHLCSHKLNKGYNDGHRIVVELKNNSTVLDSNIDIDVETNENINVWCYDTLFECLDFMLMGTNGEFCSGKPILFDELSDYIDYAKVIVTHTDGDPNTINVEAIEVKHRLSLKQVLVSIENYSWDNRSFESKKYYTHKDFIIDRPYGDPLILDNTIMTDDKSQNNYEQPHVSTLVEDDKNVENITIVKNNEGNENSTTNFSTNQSNQSNNWSYVWPLNWFTL